MRTIGATYVDKPEGVGDSDPTEVVSYFKTRLEEHGIGGARVHFIDGRINFEIPVEHTVGENKFRLAQALGYAERSGWVDPYELNEEYAALSRSN